MCVVRRKIDWTCVTIWSVYVSFWVGAVVYWTCY